MENIVQKTTYEVAKADVESLWDYAVAKMKVNKKRKKKKQKSKKKKKKKKK